MDLITGESKLSFLLFDLLLLGRLLRNHLVGIQFQDIRSQSYFLKSLQIATPPAPTPHTHLFTECLQVTWRLSDKNVRNVAHVSH